MRKEIFILSAMALLFLLVFPLGAQMDYETRALLDSPWPKFHHDLKNTGQSPYCSAPTDSLKWSYECGGLCQSSPVIGSDGTIYVGSHDRNLHAINPDGTRKWTYASGGTIWSTPAIGDDGTIYVGSYDDEVHAVNPDGSPKWTVPTGGNVSSSPTIGEDGTIYVGSWDDFLYAIEDSVTYGKVKWKYQAGNWVAFSSAAIGSDGTIYVGSFDDSLHAINPDGTKKWAYPTGGNLWSSPAIGADGTIYIGSYDTRLHAVDPSGLVKWQYATGSRITSSPAVGEDGTIYVGSNDRKLHAVNPDGSPKWQFLTGGSVQSSPAIGSNGTIYVGSLDDRLYAISSDGTELWRFQTGSNVVSCPAIGKDGTLYCGSQDRHLYAFYGPAPGLVTGGGWIPGDSRGPDGKRTFGFNSHREACVVWGQLQFNDHQTKMKVHSETMETLWDSVTVATFSGTCRVDKVRGYSFECTVEDNGEPGHGVDRFSIDIYDQYGAPYYSANGLLGGGNIQIHLPANGISDAASRAVPKPGDASKAKAEAPMPTGPPVCLSSPNPFTERTTLRFHLPASGHTTLEICDLAGRLVTVLVDAELSAGTHSVTWEKGGAPSGAYFYRLTHSGVTATGKMFVLK